MNGNIVTFWLIVISCIIGLIYNTYERNSDAFSFFLGALAMFGALIVWSFFTGK